MNKTLKLFTSSILLVVLTLVLAGCGRSKFDKYASRLRDSLENVQTVEAEAVFKDGDVTVYKYKKQVKMVSETEAEVTTTVSEMNSNFELADSTSIDKLEVKRNTLSLIIMKEELFENVVIENDTVKGNVSVSNIKEVLNNKNLEIKDTAEFTFTYVDKQIDTITITYKTLTNKDVTVSMKYTY